MVQGRASQEGRRLRSQMISAARFSHGLEKAEWLSNGSALRRAHRGVSVAAAQDCAQEWWWEHMEALKSRKCLLRKLMGKNIRKPGKHCWQFIL